MINWLIVKILGRLIDNEDNHKLQLYCQQWLPDKWCFGHGLLWDSLYEFYLLLLFVLLVFYHLSSSSIKEKRLSVRELLQFFWSLLSSSCSSLRALWPKYSDFCQNTMTPRLVVMCSVQNSHRGGHSGRWVEKGHDCDSRVQGLHPDVCMWSGLDSKRALVNLRKNHDFSSILINRLFLFSHCRLFLR